jgi:hypothetical protein
MKEATMTDHDDGQSPQDSPAHAASACANLLVPGWPARQIDTNTPHPARMYNYYLDGKDNYQVDRDAADEVVAAIPEVRETARGNLAFLDRAVRYIAAAGITQFLDIGTGIPGPDNAGKAARAVAPGARVVYVDNDPIVITHAAALLAAGDPDSTAVLYGDLRDPRAILAEPALGAVLDLAEPVALVLGAVLHFIPDPRMPGEADPYELVRTLMQALAPGSCLALSHGTADFADPAKVADAVAAYKTATAPAVPRTLDRVTGFFDGLELVDPGVVQLPWWNPDGEIPEDAHDVWMYGGIGRKT